MSDGTNPTDRFTLSEDRDIRRLGLTLLPDVSSRKTLPPSPSPPASTSSPPPSATSKTSPCAPCASFAPWTASPAKTPARPRSCWATSASRTPTISYHTHNENSRATELIEALKAGGRIAVVSDAGMPGIADPGATIAAEAIAAGITVYPIPGANAALSALIASGLNAESFTFHGFLPSKEGQRRTTLEALRARPTERTTTAIFYETPHRILDALADIVTIFGPTSASSSPANSPSSTKSSSEAPPPNSSPHCAPAPPSAAKWSSCSTAHPQTPPASALHSADEVANFMRTESLSEKDALKRVAKSRNIGKSEAYREWQRSKR